MAPARNGWSKERTAVAFVPQMVRVAFVPQVGILVTFAASIAASCAPLPSSATSGA